MNEFLGAFWRAMLFLVPAVILAVVLVQFAGFPPDLTPLAAIVLGSAASVAARRSVYESALRHAALRHAAHRPRRTMTPEDYRHLRELERELGWEPSEPCMPVEVPELAPRSLAAAGSVSGASLLSGSGSLSAKARSASFSAGGVIAACECGICGERALTYSGEGLCGPCDLARSAKARALREAKRAERDRPRPRQPADPPRPRQWKHLDGTPAQPPPQAPADAAIAALATESALHFAQLARAGRESCASPCRLCEARDRHYPTDESRALLAAKLAGFKDDAILRNWIEKDRWETGPDDAPVVTSPALPAGAREGHIDSAGRAWCRAVDDLWWIKPTPDGLWYRQDRPEGGEQQ